MKGRWFQNATLKSQTHIPWKLVDIFSPHSQWVWVKTSWNHSEPSLWLELSLAHLQWMGSQLTCIADPNLFLFIMSGHQLLLCCLKYTVCPWTSTFSFQKDDLDFVHGLPNQQATSYFWTSDRPWVANPPPSFGEIHKVKYEKYAQGLIKWRYWSTGPQSVCLASADMFN